MTKASENIYPQVRFSEETTLPTPTTDQYLIGVKDDGKAYLKNDAGTETDLTGGGGGGGGAVELIDSEVLASAAGSVSFTSISGSHNKLIIEGMARTDRSGASTDGLAVQVGNGTVDSGSNYDFWYNRDGSGGAADNMSSDDTRIDSAGSGAMLNANNADANKFAFVRITIPFYAVTDFERSVAVETFQVASGAGANITRVAGVWQNSADAIDIVTLFPEIGSNFVTGTRFYLYGVT